MQRRSLAGAAALLLGLAAAMPARADEAQVSIDNFAFTPASITVKAGTRVTWLNRDDTPHVVADAAEPRAFKSAVMDTDEKFSFVFEKPGTYRYFCTLHPHMQGVVVVQ